MQLIIDNYDYSQRYNEVRLTGSDSSPTATLSIYLVVSQLDDSYAVPSIPRHAFVSWSTDDGTVVFQGVIVYQKQEGGVGTMLLKAMDYGYYLSNNTGWYTCSTTPEQAVAQLAADIGLSVAYLEPTGVTVDYNFAGSTGTAYHSMIATLYEEAGNSTGRQYTVRFEGTSLAVREKSDSPLLRLSPGSNLSTSSNTVDVSGYCNTVEILDEVGNLIRTLGGAEEGVGMLRTVLIQQDGEDATDEANTLLSEGQGTQTVSVTCLGDVRLLPGVTIAIDQTSAGVEGIFWITSATHSWVNGGYTCQLDLEFRG